MFCSKCGAELAEGASFCSKCGDKQGARNISGGKPKKGVLKPVLIVCGALFLLLVLIAVFSTSNSNHPVRGKNWTSPSTGMEFIWIPELDMWAGKYEVTNEEYRKKEPEHDSGAYEEYSMNGSRQPVVVVNFDDAKSYAEWMTRLDGEALPPGYSYRIPSGKEWIRFARCGEERLYPWGDSWPPATGQAGNYADMVSAPKFGFEGIPKYEDGHTVTAPVEESRENEWGMYGVGGNVWEACAEDSTGQTFESWRGGSWWINDERRMRCSYYPENDDASVRTYAHGFRLVLSEGSAPANYAPALTKTFSRQGYDFTVGYPAHWNERTNNNLVILSGPAGSGEEFVTVTVQTLLSAQTGGKYRNLEDVYSDLASSLTALGGRIVKGKAAFNFPQNGQSLPGMGFGVEYEVEGTCYREMTAVIQSGSRFFFQISYTAPEELFEKYEDTGRAILSSLSITSGKTGEGNALSAMVSIDEEILREKQSKLSGWDVRVRRHDADTVWYDISTRENIKHTIDHLANMVQLWPSMWAEQYPAPQTIRISFYDAGGRLIYAEHSHITGQTVLRRD